MQNSTKSDFTPFISHIKIWILGKSCPVEIKNAPFVSKMIIFIAYNLREVSKIICIIF